MLAVWIASISKVKIAIRSRSERGLVWTVSFGKEVGKCAVSLDTYEPVRQPFVMNTSKNTEVLHPGSYIKREVIDPLELNVSDAAKALGVTRPALSALLNGRADLSSEMSLRIEKAFGVPMDKLVHMQADWNIADQRKRAGEVDVLAYRPMQKPKTQGGLF